LPYKPVDDVVVEHEAEIVELHLREALVAQHAGVVDEDVDAAPFVDRLFDHRLDRGEIGDRRAIGDRLAASRLDLGDDCLRSRRRTAGAVARTAEIVDDELRAARGEREGVLAAEAIAGTGDDGNAIFERNHHESPWERRKLSKPARGAASCIGTIAGAHW
jgi:hypothetical protein